MGKSIWMNIRVTLGAPLALAVWGCGSAAPLDTESGEMQSSDQAGAELVAPEDDPCAAVRCIAGTHCEAEEGEARCVADVFCGGIAGFECPGAGACVDDPTDDCDPENGGADCGGMCQCNAIALCIEGYRFDDSAGVCGCVEEYNPCAATTCLVGYECVVEDGEAQCVEQYNPCAATSCLEGYECVVEDGEAQCVEQVNPCAAVLCRQGTQCVVRGDEARCVPQRPRGHGHGFWHHWRGRSHHWGHDRHQR